MIDPNKVTEAINEFMQNPTWKDIFMNAPGGAMERLAIAFYFSKFHDQFKPEDFQEYRELRDEYEKSLTEEDLQYLVENNDKPNAVKHYKELLEKVQGGEKPTGRLRFEKVEQPSSEENAATETEDVTGEEGGEKIEETAVVETEGVQPTAEGEQKKPMPQETEQQA